MHNELFGRLLGAKIRAEQPGEKTARAEKATTPKHQRITLVFAATTATTSAPVALIHLIRHVKRLRLRRIHMLIVHATVRGLKSESARKIGAKLDVKAEHEKKLHNQMNVKCEQCEFVHDEKVQAELDLVLGEQVEH